MSQKHVEGVYAALLTPRHDDGSFNEEACSLLLAFLQERGLSQFAVNGATGEFCRTTPQQLEQQLRFVRSQSAKNARLLCGVGAADLNGTLALMEVAQRNGADGLLLPMPYFFPYTQDDLFVFCAEAARHSSLPILLYNLPQFTSGLDVETVCSLLRSEERIVGIKDSSGSLEIVRALTECLPDAARIIGNDSALPAAVQQGLCDGVVSGVACALPELISEIASAGTDAPGFGDACRLLDVFIEQLNAFPTPWGLKWAVQARGVFEPHFTLPLSETRLQQASTFRQWMRNTLPAVEDLRQAASDRIREQQHVNQ